MPRGAGLPRGGGSLRTGVNSVISFSVTCTGMIVLP